MLVSLGNSPRGSGNVTERPSWLKRLNVSLTKSASKPGKLIVESSQGDPNGARCVHELLLAVSSRRGGGSRGG
jgi:hypothetical protein